MNDKDSKLKDNLGALLKELTKAIKDEQEKLKNELIEILKEFGGQERLIKDLEDKGLPKSIILGNQIPDEFEKTLSRYAPTVRTPPVSSPIDKGIIVIFSWDNGLPMLDKINPLGL